MKQNIKKRKLRWDRVMILVVLVMTCLSFALNAFADTQDDSYIPVVVGAGDTMWDLIREHNPEFNGNMNEAVYETKKLNDTKQAVVYLGALEKMYLFRRVENKKS